MKAKQLLLTLFALLAASAAWANVQINETNFPDANFRNWLLSQSYGTDGVLTQSEIANIKNIEVGSKNIESLKGIEHFTALEALTCYYNKLTALDVSKNTALTNLSCGNNQLTTLDVSGNKALTGLHCQYNQLTTLNVSGCKKLYNLECYCNMIMGAGMDALVESLPNTSDSYYNGFNGYMNVIYYNDPDEQNVMTKSQVAAAKAKGWIPLWRNPASGWKEYQGSDDGTTPPEPITDVVINETNFPDANFRNWLFSQSYGYDGVLKGSEIANITEITITDRYVQSLKGIEYFKALTKLFCYRNQLTELDVSKNTALTNLSCGNNQLTTLDVSQNTTLTILGCYSNQLTTLDVSQNTALTSLSCSDNQLTTLDVSACTMLTSLMCYSNQIKGAGMDALVESLPTVSSGTISVLYNRDEQNVMTKSQVAAAKAKGWTPEWMDPSYGWREYEGSDDITPPETGIAIDAENFPDANFRNFLLGQTYGADGVLTEEEIAAVSNISLSNKYIYNLKGIEHFTALTNLYCYQNYLTSLDLSKNTQLTNVWCFNNRLTSINVSGCKALTELDCCGNQLARLNVSGCTALTKIYCYQNRIMDKEMDSLVMSLPVVIEGSMNVMGEEYVERNVMTKSQVSAAKKKGWTPKYWDTIAHKWLEYEGSGTGIEPIVDETEVALNDLGDEDVTDNVIDGIYYNLAEESGSGYSTELNCLVIGQTTDMSQTGSGEPGSEEVKENFTGIIFEVGPGAGTVLVEAEALGSTCLAVRIGTGTPSVVSTGGRKNLLVSYEVAEPTYVYIYAVSQDASSARGWRVPMAGEDALLVYGIRITPCDIADAIREIKSEQPAINNNALWFDLSGKPTAIPRQNGIYIRNGKKMIIK